MYLTKEELFNIVSLAPISAIDLIIRNKGNKILMGKRINNPAKGDWFVPGGRILKNEDISEAFLRICKSELGVKLTISNARFIGPFTHKYDTNFNDVKGVGTHYVTLAYEIPVDYLHKNDLKSMYKQHSDIKWIGENDAYSNININSSEYFKYLYSISKNQYYILNERRNSYNNLLWQTPILSLTAQAFLFIIILNGEIESQLRLIAVSLSIITAVASILLLLKHRAMEVEHAKILQYYESTNEMYPVNRKMYLKSWIYRISSFKAWIIVLLVFLTAAIFSIFDIIW